MAVNRTVLPNGTVQPGHGTPYEMDEDANWALIDQWQGGRMMADLGISGVASGLQLSTSATLTPGITAGVLYAQGQRMPFAPAPMIPPAPPNATNYLFYNSSTGFYYQASAVGATAGDALIGQVTTSSSAVTAVVNATPIMGTISISATSTPGNFTLQHFLGRTPLHVVIQMTSAGAIWWQTPDKDATFLYLVASDAGLTAKVKLW
jgi:hypothetical protein